MGPEARAARDAPRRGRRGPGAPGAGPKTTDRRRERCPRELGRTPTPHQNEAEEEPGAAAGAAEAAAGGEP
eukprot:3087620-Pyramimonas_sp.AAC.1